MARQPNEEERAELRPLADELDDLDERLAIVKARWQRAIKRIQLSCGVSGTYQLDPISLKWQQVIQGPNGALYAAVPDKDLAEL
jgi:hypothetical protein